MCDAKKIIIVGASSGIGRETAICFAQAGWKVGVAARRQEQLNELQKLYPNQIYTETMDITEPSCTKSLNSLIEKMGGMDVYLHVSGIGKQNSALEEGIEIDTLRTNGEGFARCMGEAYRYFIKTGCGHIAAVTSIAGTKGLGMAPAYSATKRFQSTYLQCLAQLSSIKNVHVKFTDIKPGFVATELLNDVHQYPMLMTAPKVAKRIYKAILKQERSVVIDWRYNLLTKVWKLIPDCIWERLVVKTKK